MTKDNYPRTQRSGQPGFSVALGHKLFAMKLGPALRLAETETSNVWRFVRLQVLVLRPCGAWECVGRRRVPILCDVPQNSNRTASCVRKRAAEFKLTC